MTRGGFYSSLITEMVNAHIFFYITESFQFSSWRNFPKCPVLEKDQRFLPQGTFLQSSRQATKAHHILQDVSFSLLGLWRLLTFPSFWSYFPWWFYGFTTILKTLGWIKHQNSVRLFARFLHPRAFKTFHNDNKWWMVGSSNYTPKKTNSLKLEFWKPCLQMCFSKTIE